MTVPQYKYYRRKGLVRKYKYYRRKRYLGAAERFKVLDLLALLVQKQEY
jgi:hypothetical protein